jgi:hypothetical protein
MTDQVITDPSWVPEACTLPTTEQPLRLAEFDDLLATAVGGVDRLTATRARLRLTGDGDLEARVRDLTDRERQCCSFFTFTVSPTDTGVSLDIEVPVAYADVLDALTARAAAGGSR